MQAPIRRQPIDCLSEDGFPKSFVKKWSLISRLCSCLAGKVVICLMSVSNIRGAKEDNVDSDLQSAADGG